MTRDVQLRVGAIPDGFWGIDTAAKVLAKLPPPEPGTLNPEPFAIDPRSQKNIATLWAPAQEKAKQLLEKLALAGIHAKVISGTRTYQEQDALYAQGRTAGGKRVTNARGGYSNHNFGIAFDIGIFTAEGAYLEESPQYSFAGQIGKALGLSWGGDWKTFADEPHFELRPGWATAMSESDMLAELRQRHNEGTAIA